METIWRTVLVTDARNSSKAYFSEKAEEAMVRIERDRALFLQIAVAGGGEEVRDRGDGSMFAFCDPAEAVRAAMAMQAEIARLNADEPPETLRLVHRMGVHIGEIKLLTTRIALEGRETVRRKMSGDIVVTAARLEGICHPGEVCFSNDVYKATRGKIAHEFRCLDSTLKGFDRPVRCWSSRLDREWARPLTAEEELGKQRRKDERHLRAIWEEEQRERARRRRALRIVAPLAALSLAFAGVRVIQSNDDLRKSVGTTLSNLVGVEKVVENRATAGGDETKTEARSAPEDSPIEPSRPPVIAHHTAVRKKAKPLPQPDLVGEKVAQIVKKGLESGEYGAIKDGLEKLDPRSPDEDRIVQDAQAMEVWKSWLQKKFESDTVRAKAFSSPVGGLTAMNGISEEGIVGVNDKGPKTLTYAALTTGWLDAIIRTETPPHGIPDPEVVGAPASLGRLKRIAQRAHDDPLPEFVPPGE